MLERFLQYSLDHHRPVRVLMADTLKYQNILVLALEDSQVSFLSSGRKMPKTLPLSAFLSAAYARGDDGDTLQYLANGGA